MTTIAGKYKGTVITDREDVSVDDLIVRVDRINQNIISLGFERFGHRFKLTCVIHQEDEGQYHLHVMDKFTSKFHVQGTGLRKYYKTGIHGVWDKTVQSLKLDLMINEFNKEAIRFSFIGQKNEGSTESTPFTRDNMLLF
ncbi:MAG: hypothetical protein AAFO69_02890 [Bacteroidota bacterium]